MEKTTIVLPKYGWSIDLFTGFTCGDEYAITGHLRSIGCSDRLCAKAYAHMVNCNENEGFTYSSSSYRKSVMVVYETDSFSEFLNTLMHENAHVCAHIVRSMNNDMDEEEFCYLTGFLASQEADVVTREAMSFVL